MELQYVSDELGQPTAVLVPIEEWKKNLSKENDIQNSKHSKPFNPSDFRGCISKETGEKMQEYVKQSREEWR